MSEGSPATAVLLYADPAEDASGPVPGTSTPPRSSLGKPRRAIPPPSPEAQGVKVGEIPNALLPPPPPDASDLVMVGEVLGYQVHARRDVMARADRLKQSLGREHWPSDALLATILALRIGGKMTYREIAEALNMTERHVLRVAKRGKKESLVEKEIARLDREGMPMAVENVLDGLERQDKEYTLEYMKGRGVFRQKHEQVQAGPAAAFTGLVVQFVHDGNAPIDARAGSIVANPNRALAAGTAVIDIPAVPGVPGTPAKPAP